MCVFAFLTFNPNHNEHCLDASFHKLSFYLGTLLGVCQVRRLAIRLLVDDFRLGVGSEGASLARAVLLPSGSLDGSNTTRGRSTLSFTTAGDWRAGLEGNGADARGREHSGSARGDEHGTPLGCLLQHRATLLETDGEGYDLCILRMAAARMYIASRSCRRFP